MIRGVIQYKGFKSCQPSTLKRYVKEENQATIQAWHKDYLPQHFQESAFNRYRYQQRSKSYQDKKQKRYGHRKPLVRTGQMEKEVERAIRISGTSKGARGVMNAPKYMYQYKPGQPNKAEEVVRTTAKELTELAKRFDERMQKRFDNDLWTEKKRI